MTSVQSGDCVVTSVQSGDCVVTSVQSGDCVVTSVKLVSRGPTPAHYFVKIVITAKSVTIYRVHDQWRRQGGARGAGTRRPGTQHKKKIDLYKKKCWYICSFTSYWIFQSRRRLT